MNAAELRNRTKQFALRIMNVVEASAFWLEVTGESGLVKEKRLAPLLQEANELVAIMTAARKTAGRKGTRPERRSQPQ